MADVNEYAIIANQIGGIADAAREIGVDAGLLERAIAGESLDRAERNELETAVNEFEKDSYLDFRDVENFADTLYEVKSFINDVELADRFAVLVAEGNVDLNYLENNATDLFADLNPVYAESVIEWIEQGNDASVMFDAYLSDLDFWEIDDSAFWEWFRDTFYSD